MDISKLTIAEKLSLAENENTDVDTLVLLIMDDSDDVANTAINTLDSVDSYFEHSASEDFNIGEWAS